MLTPYPANGKSYGDTYYDPFWAIAQDLGTPVGLHVIARPNYHGSEWYKNPTFQGSPFYTLRGLRYNFFVRPLGNRLLFPDDGNCSECLKA